MMPLGGYRGAGGTGIGRIVSRKQQKTDEF